MRVVWAKAAINRLRDIRAFIAARNPDAALAMAARLRSTVRRLGDFPGVGRASEVPDVRQAAVPGTPFVIYYRVTPGVVEVLWIWHSAQDRSGPE